MRRSSNQIQKASLSYPTQHLRGDTECKIDQIVFLDENEIGADFDTLTSLVTVQ